MHGGDDAHVDAVITRLGLLQCADTLVGGDTGGKAVRGISGGERKRLAIASETLCLLHSRGDDDDDADGEGKYPHSAADGDGAAAKGREEVRRGFGGVILADEPTTGLDAHQADKIVEKLGETARLEFATVVCVLHQPRSTIFERLDDLVLLAEGRVPSPVRMVTGP